MIWPEFRETVNGIAKKRNKAGVMQTGSWYAVARHPFTRKRMSEPAGAKSEFTAARKRLEVRIQDILDGKEAQEKPKTLFQATELFRTHMIGAYKKKTADAYCWAMRKLETYFKDEIMLNGISAAEFLKFLDSLFKSHNVNGIRDIAKACSAFFSFCIKRGYLKVNPAFKCLEENAYQEKVIERYYTDEECREIIKNCVIKRPVYTDEFQDIVRVALNTGFRQGEIPVIKSSWIYNGYINLPMEMTKFNKPRKLPIHEKWLKPIIDKYLAKGTEHLFEGWSKQRIQTAWRRSVIRAKRNPQRILKGRCRFHDMRHTFASNFLKAEGNMIQDLQAALGHGDISTTMRYVHLQEDHLRGPINRMPNLFMIETPTVLAVA